MNVLTAFLETAWAARSPFLLAAYLLVRALERRLISIPRLSRSGALVVCHFLAIFVAAVQTSAGYEPKVALLVALGFALLCAVALATKLLFHLALPKLGVTIPRILADIVTAVGVAVALIIVGQRAGFSVAGLITTSAVLTAVIGFALQDTLGNIMGGLALQLDNSVKVGDWISLGAGQPAGRVAEIRWRYTAIETRTWDTIIVPNGVLTKSQVTVIGRRSHEPSQQRRQVEFFVDFRTPPTEVIRAVERSLQGSSIANVADSPPPRVLFFGVKEWRKASHTQMFEQFVTGLIRGTVLSDQELPNGRLMIFQRNPEKGSDVKVTPGDKARLVIRAWWDPKADRYHICQVTLSDLSFELAPVAAALCMTATEEKLVEKSAEQGAGTAAEAPKP